MKGASAGSRRILVVDDESLVCHTVTILLKVDGHTVTTASSGEEALTIFEPGKFDLVVTDYAMPSMTGAELAAAIKNRAPEQPVVLLTAYAERLRGQPQALTNVDFIIEKPLSIESIRRAINTFALVPKPAVVASKS
jgi:CheY-like chemotaxis protein